MSLLAHYRGLLEHEKDCNLKMLAMLESISVEQRSDAKFQRAVNIAGHLVACRENWLDYMNGNGTKLSSWFEDSCDYTLLAGRYASSEAAWEAYLAGLDDVTFAQDFEFAVSETERFSFPVEIQVVQLAGHAWYHRGQVALLVDQLGGVTVDTDYADWWWENRANKS